MKNHHAACFLSLSSPSVMTRVTTCGCPATPIPPRKKARAQRVKPNLVSFLDSKIVEKKLNSKSAGKIFASPGSIALSSAVRLLTPPTSFTATTQSTRPPIIITID